MKTFTIEASSRSRRGTSKLWWVLGGMGVAGLVLAMVALTSIAWRDALAAEQRVLPGTVVGGTDVGLRSADDLNAVVADASEAALDRTVTLVHGDRRWEVSARDLDATTDAREVVAGALEASASVSPWRAAAARWLGRGLGFERDVQVRAPTVRLLTLVDELAARIDRDPVEATLAWHNDDLHVRPAGPGARLDRDATLGQLAGALDVGGVVELPVATTAPSLTADRLAPWRPAMREAVDAALDRLLTVRHGEGEWPVTPRELGAIPDPRALVEAVLDGREVSVSGVAAPGPGSRIGEVPVPLRLPGAMLADYVESLAAEIDTDPLDAEINYSTGRIELRPEQPGLAVDRDAASEALQQALNAGSGTVDLPVVDLQPEVTAADYHHVLLVRLDERRLYLYVDGEVAREWPVAVGAPGSATPTGEFRIGLKRHLPTWYNPAPDGWGADMPAVVEPGPTNPLGLRALNWNSGGRDTLIRFHGTSDVSSIGRAASRGCVRLTNSHVVELFDLVESGTKIVSLRG